MLPLDLLTVWATKSVRVEVPLSAAPRVATSPGYTHDAFFDELGVRLDRDGIVTAVRARSRATGWADVSPDEKIRVQRRLSSSLSGGGDGGGSDTGLEMTDVSGGAGGGDDAAGGEPSAGGAMSATAIAAKEEGFSGAVVCTGLRLTKVNGQTVSGRAEAVRAFTDLVVLRPGGIALLPPSPPPTVDTIADVDLWHWTKAQSDRERERRKGLRAGSFFGKMTRSPSQAALQQQPAPPTASGAAREGRAAAPPGTTEAPFYSAPHDGASAGAPPAADACGDDGGRATALRLSLLDGERSGYDARGSNFDDDDDDNNDDDDDGDDGVDDGNLGIGLSRGGGGAPLSAEAADGADGAEERGDDHGGNSYGGEYGGDHGGDGGDDSDHSDDEYGEYDDDYGEDDGEATLAMAAARRPRRGGPLGRLFGWRGGGGSGGGGGGGGAPPSAESDGGDGRAKSRRASKPQAASDPLDIATAAKAAGAPPAWLEFGPGRLNFSKTKVLRTPAGVEVTAYKLAEPHPPGWVLDRSPAPKGFGDKRSFHSDKPHELSAFRPSQPWLRTVLKAERGDIAKQIGFTSVVFAAPLRTADAARDRDPITDKYGHGIAGGEGGRGGDDGAGAERPRAVDDPLRRPTHFRYVARRCTCTLRLARFVSSSALQKKSGGAAGGGARPASILLKPPDHGWTIDAMDVLQAIGARPEVPALARRARTPSTAAFVLDLTMLLSVRRLTNEATGELLPLVEVLLEMTCRVRISSLNH